MGRIKPSRPIQKPKVKKEASVIHEKVRLSFEYVRVGERFCLSAASSQNAKEAVDCLRQVTSLTLQQLFETGRKGRGKAGLNYEKLEAKALKVQLPPHIDKTLEVQSVRASARFRIWGIMADAVFHVFWFDIDHEVAP